MAPFLFLDKEVKKKCTESQILILAENIYIRLDIFIFLLHSVSFPGGASDKKPTCQSRRCKRHRFNPWVRKIPLEQEMAPHSSILAWKISCPEEPDTVHEVAKSQTRLSARTHTHTHTHTRCIAQGTMFALL